MNIHIVGQTGIIQTGKGSIAVIVIESIGSSSLIGNEAINIAVVVKILPNVPKRDIGIGCDGARCNSGKGSAVVAIKAVAESTRVADIVGRIHIQIAVVVVIDPIDILTISRFNGKIIRHRFKDCRSGFCQQISIKIVLGNRAVCRTARDKEINVSILIIVKPRRYRKRSVLGNHCTGIDSTEGAVAIVVKQEIGCGNVIECKRSRKNQINEAVIIIVAPRGGPCIVNGALSDGARRNSGKLTLIILIQI